MPLKRELELFLIERQVLDEDEPDTSCFYLDDIGKFNQITSSSGLVEKNACS